uniref:Capsid protein n=1 Tax=Grus nigricollis-associatied genomovirus TaxID=3077354 RepID=A0AAF0YY75_9VIRU|nr:MAG: capsid protein [Grus nigricollis-associatied genomovirus]
MPRYAKKTTRRRRVTRRKTTTKRKYVKKSKAMTAKRVKAIAATKKKDHYLTGERLPNQEWPDGRGLQYINMTLNAHTYMILHSPSYIPFRDEPTPYGRNAHRIHHTSYAEKMELDVGFDCSVEHRRIVFSNNYEDRRAVCAIPGPNSSQFETLRNCTQVELDDFQDIFQGTRNRDWYHYTRAPLDRKKVTVHYDKLFTHTPKNPLGQVFNRKFYHKINKWLDFPDVEHGNDQISEGNWPGIKSPKIFIMDMFKSARDTTKPDVSPRGEQYMSLSFDATNYWTEPS